MILGMKPIILASQSPRRKEILGYFNIPFEVVHPSFDEEAAEVLSDPAKYATSLAEGKVRSLIATFPDDLILSADTVVFLDGVYYSKPKDREEAKQFLRTFSGKWQTVVTGVAVSAKGKVYTDHEVTKVKVNILTDEQIENYLNLNSWSDKAGGYSIFGTSSLLVEKIEGCFYNVMGLSPHPLVRLLAKGGVDLWNHL